MYIKQSDATDYLREGLHDGDGTIEARRLFPHGSRLPIKMEVWTLEPGVSEGGHVHKGDGALEEIYYILEGSGVMWVDGEDVPFLAGEAIMVSPGADHGFRNTGDNKLKLLIVWGKPGESE